LRALQTFAEPCISFSRRFVHSSMSAKGIRNAFDERRSLITEAAEMGSSDARRQLAHRVHAIVSGFPKEVLDRFLSIMPEQPALHLETLQELNTKKIQVRNGLRIVHINQAKIVCRGANRSKKPVGLFTSIPIASLVLQPATTPRRPFYVVIVTAHPVTEVLRMVCPTSTLVPLGLFVWVL
jgi:hypothetical protein